MKSFGSIICLFLVCGVYAQEKADQLFQLGNYSKAIVAYQKDTTSAHNQRMTAKSYAALENYELAISHYLNAIAIDSTLQLQQFELAKLYYQTNHIEDAISVYKKLIKKDEDNPTFQYLLGVAYNAIGNGKKGYECFQKAYELDPNYLKASYQLAKTALLNGSYDTCLSLINEGLKVNPNNVDFINLMAIYHYDVQNYKKAIPWFEKLLEKTQGSAIIYRRFALCLFQRNEYERAIENWKNQILYDKYNPDPYLQIGLAYTKLKNYTEAETYINQSIELKQNSFYDDYEALAVVYQQQQSFKKALHYYELAKEENPSKGSMLYYKIAVTADKVYTSNPKKVLEYYKTAQENEDSEYLKMYMQKRIDELESEILAQAG
ncbi:Anaphase-promoting complex, cyclosome, subunit 3 [Pustulibacterium marinum]|uniref:Anaphase-promoting complex, cyclosome, subunit 3 n=1 Tax=Pustulibacterium marinum TaxID=1224947 RepID=A0A1I7I5P3_9FLAO|nr:tetratricopeptide repeat protein [Pustulibacterium marinum]SFU68279.1 Anaphase-promoting complex, cyclosome, subunit 3 [Pustulibacterium marinum]